jgi:rhamnosyltransferase
VRSQDVDREVEIVVVDSGSTDGSLDIARQHGARVHEIAKTEFSHGGTRNLLMRLASGDHVALLTQDATPASSRWLQSLLDGFGQAADVAAVFGPHLPRPGASHMIHSEMERHFATWGGGRSIAVQRLEPTPAGIAAYRRAPGELSFMSDVNCCLARWAWEQIPYREVPYAEDQLLGRELIEAGYAKVFHPDAAVLHSHDYPPVQFFRRFFDEFRSLREVLGYVVPAGPTTTLRDVRGLVSADREWLQSHGVHGTDLFLSLASSTRHWTIRMAGAILGSRADRLPPAVRRRLSLEGRETFVPYDVPQSPLLDTDADSAQT